MQKTKWILAFVVVGLVISPPCYAHWTITYGGSDSDRAHSIQQTSDGEISETSAVMGDSSVGRALSSGVSADTALFAQGTVADTSSFSVYAPPTYDATGNWTYSTTNNWAVGCLPAKDRRGIMTITQTGEEVRAVAGPLKWKGTVSGPDYTISTKYPEEGGITELTANFTLSSSTFGSGAATWYWTDGIYSCHGGSDFTMVKALTLEVPNGGELVPSGSTYIIQWYAPPELATFKLKYSMNNGTTWKPIDSGITDTSYDWTVPIPPKDKKKCLVKVIGYDGWGEKVGVDKSDAPFTIAVVEVTSPNGGEVLISGDPHTITWTTNETKEPVTKVVLKYTKNGGKRWKKIETLTENTGTYDWTVPDVPKTKIKCKVKVVLKDARGNTVGSDTSDSYFTIEPAP
jgi:hypothetical protein